MKSDPTLTNLSLDQRRRLLKIALAGDLARCAAFRQPGLAALAERILELRLALVREPAMEPG